MKYRYFILLCVVMAFCGTSCNKSQNFKPSDNASTQETDFFGDSTMTIISSNRPNGYLVKIFMSYDLVMLNLSRGDSINQYIPIHAFPHYNVRTLDGNEILEDSVGTFVREIEIPVDSAIDCAIDGYLIFMDVNFDGEDELVICNRGLKMHYACFDLVNGDSRSAPGILQCLHDEPYNSFVSSGYGNDERAYTEFDYDEKTIHIFERTSGCSSVETWCKLVADDNGEKPALRVVRKEEWDVIGRRSLTKIYVRENGELKLLKEEIEEID